MDVRDLMAQLQKTRKYARLGDALLMRVCTEQLMRHPRPKEALKAAKNQLHIMYGAFYPDGCHQRAADIIAGLEAQGRNQLVGGAPEGGSGDADAADMKRSRLRDGSTLKDAPGGAGGSDTSRGGFLHASTLKGFPGEAGGADMGRRRLPHTVMPENASGEAGAGDIMLGGLPNIATPNDTPIGAGGTDMERRGLPHADTPKHAHAGAWLPASESLRDASLALLALHTSTRERLPAVEAFYAHIARFAPRAAHVLDIGCGFAPFALPLMDIAEGAVYDAWDLSLATVELINRFFAVCGLPPGARVGDAQRLLAGEGWTGGAGGAAVSMQGALDHEGHIEDPCDRSAHIRKAMSPAPRDTENAPPADLAMMLKLIPLLEQQRKGLAFEMLDAMPARLIAVSFPIKSLGGRNKSMADHYSRMLEGGLSDLSRILDKTVIGDELVYMIAGNVK